MSDGTAANLLVRRRGGPGEVTAKIRDTGAGVTRLGRCEPELGLVLSGDRRDTTSPEAVAQLVRRVVTSDDLLTAGSVQRLLLWMPNTQTLPTRLRARLLNRVATRRANTVPRVHRRFAGGGRTPIVKRHCLLVGRGDELSKTMAEALVTCTAGPRRRARPPAERPVSGGQPA